MLEGGQCTGGFPLTSTSEQAAGWEKGEDQRVSSFLLATCSREFALEDHRDWFRTRSFLSPRF